MTKSTTPLGDNALEIQQVQAENLHYLMSQAYAAIDRVRELHYPVNDGGCGDPDCCSPSDSEDFCIVCQGYEYPCETIKALDGGQ